MHLAQRHSIIQTVHFARGVQRHSIIQTVHFARGATDAQSLSRYGSLAGKPHLVSQPASSLDHCRLPGLKPQVRDRGYLVTIGERLWVTEPGRSIFPDISLVDRGEKKDAVQSGAAVLEADQPIRVTIASSEVRRPFLEILDAKDQHLVTGIEILSPSNKLGCALRAKYRAKQREVLQSRASLVEIDLLRGGRHAVAIPEHSLEPQVPYDYLACLSRAARAGEFEWYPISLRKRLPRICASQGR